MHKWERKLDLSLMYRTETWTNKNVHELGKFVAKKIKQTIDIDNYDKWGWHWEEVVDDLEQIFTEEEAKEVNESNYQWCIDNNCPEDYFEYTPLENFDNCMETVYDLCDAHNIWVETNPKN